MMFSLGGFLALGSMLWVDTLRPRPRLAISWWFHLWHWWMQALSPTPQIPGPAFVGGIMTRAPLWGTWSFPRQVPGWDRPRATHGRFHPGKSTKTKVMLKVWQLYLLEIPFKWGILAKWRNAMGNQTFCMAFFFSTPLTPVCAFGRSNQRIKNAGCLDCIRSPQFCTPRCTHMDPSCIDPTCRQNNCSKAIDMTFQENSRRESNFDLRPLGTWTRQRWKLRILWNAISFPKMVSCIYHPKTQKWFIVNIKWHTLVKELLEPWVRKSMPNEITTSYIEMIFLWCPLGRFPPLPQARAADLVVAKKAGSFWSEKGAVTKRTRWYCWWFRNPKQPPEIGKTL